MKKDGEKEQVRGGKCVVVIEAFTAANPASSFYKAILVDCEQMWTCASCFVAAE